MGVLFYGIVLIGLLLNTIFTGFTKPSIIFMILTALVIIYSLPKFQNYLMVNKKFEKLKIINLVICGLFIVLILIYGRFLPSSDIYVNAEKMSQISELIQKNQLKDAEKSLLEILRKEPNNIFANQNIAVAYLKNGRNEEAKKYLDVIRSVADYDENYWYNYGAYFFAVKDYNNALLCFERAISINPKMVEGYFQAGNASYLSRNFEKSKYYLEYAKYLSPDSSKIYYLLAKAHIQFMEYKEAQDLLIEALKLNPSKEIKAKIEDSLMEVTSYKGGDVLE